MWIYSSKNHAETRFLCDPKSGSYQCVSLLKFNRGLNIPARIIQQQDFSVLCPLWPLFIKATQAAFAPFRG